MNYNNYNLCQLLELALRVPEVGAVNFNILYYILKTVIQKQGLENVKPVFALDTPATADPVVKEQLKKASVRCSYSAESLQATADEDHFKYGSRKTKPEKEEDGNDETISQAKPDIQTKPDSQTKTEISQTKSEISPTKPEISQVEPEISQVEPEISQTKPAIYQAKTDILKTTADIFQTKSVVSKAKSKDDDVEEDHTKWKKMKFFKRLDLVEKEISQERTIELQETKFLDVHTSKLEGIATDVTELMKEIFSESSEESGDEKDKYNKADSVDKKPKRRAHWKKKDAEILSEIQHINSELNLINEKLKLLPEQEFLTASAELRKLKSEWYEMVHGFEKLKETVNNIESQTNNMVELPSVINRLDLLETNNMVELPSVINRLDLLETYMFAEPEEQLRSKEKAQRLDFDATVKSTSEVQELHKRPKFDATDKFISRAKIITESFIPEAETDLPTPETFKPSVKEYEKAEYHSLQKRCGHTVRRLLAIAQAVALAKDMEKKKGPEKYKTMEPHRESEEYFYDEHIYEMPSKSPSEEFGETLPAEELAAAYAIADIESSTFVSPDILEEHSRQLKEQVIMFVKKRLKALEVNMQHIESDFITLRNKNEILDRSFKEFAGKLTFVETNFSQRAGDLAELKDRSESHQVSIISIMHHLNRKAEAYLVNQKVSKKELIVIEDRVQKLFTATLSAVTKLTCGNKEDCCC